jgi:hypothetical protein
MVARHGRVMLTAIAKRDHGESFTIMKESKMPLRLLQFTEKDSSPEEKTVNIPHNLTQYFNVCSLKEDPPGAPPGFLLQVAHGESKYSSLGSKINKNNEYKFFISVDSENSIPLAVEMVVSVGSDLGKLEVRSVNCEKREGKKCFAE